MDDLLKKALGERAVLRKLPRLLRDMLLVVCLLSLSLLKAQADPQKQKISVDMSDARSKKFCSPLRRSRIIIFCITVG